MNKEFENGTVAFGMTSSEISEAVKSLAKRRDTNHPEAETGSYDDFLNVVDAGHKALLAQEGYGKLT